MSSIVEPKCAGNPVTADTCKPQSMDVLLGRGKSFMRHVGNMLLQGLILSNLLRYFESSVTEKRDIIVDILRTIQKTGQFLLYKENQWTTINDDTAKRRIAHAFQYHIRNVFRKGLTIPSPPTTKHTKIRPMIPESNNIVDVIGYTGNIYHNVEPGQPVHGLPNLESYLHTYSFQTVVPPHETWYEEWCLQQSQNIPINIHSNESLTKVSNAAVDPSIASFVVQQCNPTITEISPVISDCIDCQLHSV